MKEINTEIRISATPGKIWEILMDLENWHKWNPIINNIKGKLNIGNELAITMSDSKGNKAKKYNATITELNKNKRFSFIAKMMAEFIFSAERIIELKTIEKETKFIQREIYTGIMVSLFWKKLSTDALDMLNSMNQALKKEVEK
ncbi:hypothetical protein MHTCC0001_35730 [Flavobacteriaceae bacterium MHTCC 0001]